MLIWGPAALAQVRVRSSTGCIEPEALQRRLQPVLEAHAGQALEVRVSATPGAGGQLLISLSVSSRAGEELLRRAYHIPPADCGDVGNLLLVVLDRFFSSFPRERWAAGPRSPEPGASGAASASPGPRTPPAPGTALPGAATSRLTRTASRRTPRPRAGPALELTLRAAVGGQFVPLGADAEIGGRLELDLGYHRLGAGLHSWLALPRELGPGQVLELGLVAGLGWRYDARPWQPGVELRAGALMASGQGFEDNRQAWAPWLEAVASLERRWRRLSVGFQLGVALLQHRVVTSDGGQQMDVSLLRVGLFIALPLWRWNI